MRTKSKSCVAIEPPISPRGKVFDGDFYQPNIKPWRRLELAQKLGIGVNAGHGLNYSNIKRMTTVRGIEEYNIGHAIIARAVFVGLERAVRDMYELVRFA